MSLKVGFLQNLDTSAGFTTSTFPANSRPYALSGYNPDGPRWDCNLAISEWNTSTAAVATHSFEISGRNNQAVLLPAWMRALLVTQTATPTATGHRSIDVVMRGNCLGKVHFLFTA